MGNESTNLCFLNGLDSMTHHRGTEGTEKTKHACRKNLEANRDLAFTFVCSLKPFFSECSVSLW